MTSFLLWFGVNAAIGGGAVIFGALAIAWLFRR
jgi:glutamate/tyrosine decarboxylase-like PLP-dependent enzyme